MLSRRSFKVIAATFALVISLASIANSRQEPPKIVRKAGGVLVGTATERAEPVYPPLAKAARISGSVVVEVTIDEGGNVIDARALSGHPLLKDSAVAAAQQWKFKPTALNGVPVKVIGTITFHYNMPNNSREIEEINQQIAANPNSPELYLRLGMALRVDNQYPKAIEAYKRAVELRSDYIDAYIQYGALLDEMGDFEKALEVFNMGLSGRPDDARLYLAIANTNLNLGRHDNAIEAARQALSLNPNPQRTSQAHSIIGNTFLRQKRYQEAIEALKEAARITPAVTHIHLSLGIAYVMTGDKEAAMAELNFLKEKDPQAAELLSGKIKNIQ